MVMARPSCLLAGVDRPFEGPVVMAQPLRLLPVVVQPSYTDHMFSLVMIDVCSLVGDDQGSFKLQI